jgi:cytochrome P450
LTIHAMVWLYIATRISIPFFTSPLRRLPSPPGERFLLGHLNFNGGKPCTILFEDMINGTPNDGLLVLWGPLYLTCDVILTRPDTLMDMLNSHNYDWEKPSLSKKVLAGILGEGLANVEGTKHKTMRRVVAPAFSGRQIRDLAPLFYAKGIALADVMARRVRETDDGVLELMALVSRVTLDIIGAAGVGMDFNTIENEESPLAKLYDSVANPPAFFMLVDMIFPKWLIRQLRGTAFARTVEAQSRLREEVRALMQEKKAHMNQEESAQPSKDIIASIMKSGDFSDDYLVSQLLTFLAAG